MITYWSHEDENGGVQMLGGYDYYGDYDVLKERFVPSDIRGCDYVTVEEAESTEIDNGQNYPAYKEEY